MTLIDAIHAAAAEGASRTLSPEEVQELSGILRAAKAFLETRDALRSSSPEDAAELWRLLDELSNACASHISDG